MSCRQWNSCSPYIPACPLPPTPVCTPGSAFSAVLNVPSQSITAVSAAIPINQEITGSADFNVSTSQFVAPIAGIFQFSFGLDLVTSAATSALLFANVANGSPLTVTLLSNGINSVATWNFNASEAGPTTDTKAGVVTVRLAAGQIISLAIAQPLASLYPANPQTLAGNAVIDVQPYRSWFSGVYVGA